MATASASVVARDINYDEAKVAAVTLPPLLGVADATSVTTAEQWTTARRPELLDLFRRHVYGRTPPMPGDLNFEVTDIRTNALGGLATRKLIHISLADFPQWRGIDLMLYVPNSVKQGAPVFLGLSFYGNHAVTTETDVLLSQRWMRNVADKGVIDHRATTASRGVESRRWPLETIIGRGYAVATAYCGDIEPDHSEGWKEGIRSTLSPDGEDTRWKSDDWGAIGAWSWGLSRMLDYCETDSQIDPKRAVVIGHSRLGKAALWTGAQDERFALVISNNSGEGGAAITRRHYGETVKIITTAFPHWFAPGYAAYADRVDDLPVDQHMLVALMAPRPVYIASAQGDRWADPRGEFLSGVYAGEVYELFGITGLGTESWPAAEVPLGDHIGYHLRAGKHDITAYDWNQYLDFADRHLPAQTP